MATKKTKPSITIRDWEHCDRVLREMSYTAATLQSEEADLNQELTEIRESHEQEFTLLSGQIKELRAAVEAFAIKHRADFGQGKTKRLVHGSLHFRVTPPAVKTLNRKWTFESVLAVVRQAGRRLAGWVRVKHELDKEAVLADYAAEKVADTDLADVGLRVVQAETFDVDLNLDKIAATAS